MNDLLLKFKIYGFRKFILYSLSEVIRHVWLQGVLHRFSQKGEDVAIYEFLKKKKRGFYIDVGANDPVRFNNTKYFYDRGWRGINIEPDINCFEKIVKNREGDINLNLGLGNTDSELVFYQFIPNTLSTFSSKDAKRYIRRGYFNIAKRKVRVEKLSQVLKKYTNGKTIDFMSIDTEGYNKEVLKSNDWKKYRPRVICVESVGHLLNGLSRDTKLKRMLEDVGYERYLDNGINSIYVDKHFVVEK